MSESLSPTDLALERVRFITDHLERGHAVALRWNDSTEWCEIRSAEADGRMMILNGSMRIPVLQDWSQDRHSMAYGPRGWIEALVSGESVL